MNFLIDRCLCFNQTFATLKAVAEAQELTTVEDLQRHVAFGAKCELCRPYVRAMLETGETSFAVLLHDTP